MKTASIKIERTCNVARVIAMDTIAKAMIKLGVSRPGELFIWAIWRDIDGGRHVTFTRRNDYHRCD